MKRRPRWLQTKRLFAICTRSQRRNPRGFGHCSPRTATGGTSLPESNTTATKSLVRADIYSVAFPDMHRELHDLYDIFGLEDGNVSAFDCYYAGTIMLAQLGVLGNLEASLKK